MFFIALYLFIVINVLLIFGMYVVTEIFLYRAGEDVFEWIKHLDKWIRS
jgi:hypothetical protein